MTLADLGVSRLNRILLVVLGLAIYAMFCLGLARYGYLQVTGSAFALLLGIWILGFIVLMFADETRGRFDAGTLTFSKALWCNLGVVVTAALVPHVLRLLLLVVPLFGVLYAALHLSHRQMLGIALITWLAYLVGAAGLAVVHSAHPAFESLLALAFTCMMAGMTLLASEVTALRIEFDQRRVRLNEAMEQLAELAMRDELTGLFNRRYIMDVLARQKALADRGQMSFTLCYCDLDHFKRINDRYGHQVGDRVLNDFAQVAESVVRSVDFVARIGGEDFLLVLEGAAEETARQVARRLAERTKFLAVIPEEPDFRLTVSVGVASFRAGERVEDVIQRADRALYEAKSQGRDQIVIGS
ncbi:MAG: GGDEF domain-containing protein [Gammaproteobacteria bacterium]